MAAATTKNGGANQDGQNGWAEYRRLVLNELERLSNVVATIQQHNSSTQLLTVQAINDAKQHALDKISEAARRLDIDYEKKMNMAEDDTDRKLRELESRHAKQFGDIKRDLNKQEKDLTQTNKKLDKTDKEVTSLKAKSLMLGATAGFVVAVAGVVATIIFSN